MAPHLLLAGLSPDGRAEVDTAAQAVGCTSRELGPDEELPSDPGPEGPLIVLEPGAPSPWLADLSRRKSLPGLIVLLAEGQDLSGSSLGWGACEALERPVTPARLERAVAKTQAMLGLRRERDLLRNPVASLPLIQGSSGAAKRLAQEIERVAGTPRTTVLVQGPVGTRKEQVARTIHLRSARRQAPFVVLRPPGVEGELSEHFGWAQGGTLFLAHVARFSGDFQAQLLELLEQLSSRGPQRPLPGEPDLRLIASSSGDLEQALERGHLREDLFYRLNVLTLRVPALAERREDLLELALAILSRCGAELGRTFHGFSGAARSWIEEQPWPGNLRELELAVQRAALFTTKQVVGIDAFGPASEPPQAGDGVLVPQDRSLRAMEESLIKRTLAEENGNRSRAARVLGINRTTLYNKLRQYGIA